MAITYLDIQGTYSGPGAYSYNVASYPGGAVLFVNSATGLDNRGRVKFMGQTSQSGVRPSGTQGPTGDPTKPLASVFGPNGALSFTQANSGDVVVVAPGHTETLATGAAISVPAGVSIVGGGYGNSRPTFQFTTSNATFIQPASHCQFNNLIFDLTGFAAVAKGFLITSSGVQFIGCRVIQASATNQATVGILLNTGGDDFVFYNSEIDGTAAAITAGIGISNPTTNNVNRPQIVNALIHGQYATSPISLLSTGSSEILIADCVIRQEHATTTFVISIPTGNTFLATFAYNTYLSVAAATGTATTIYNQATPGTGFASAQNFVRLGGAAYAASALV